MNHQSRHPADELVDTQVEGIRSLAASDAELTEEAVRQLVRLAYDASLLTEEGRYPVARLVVCKPGGPGISLPFSVPLAKANALRKLLPVVSRPGVALAVYPRASGWECVGTLLHSGAGDTGLNIEPRRTKLSFLVLETSPQTTPAVASVIIEGPARIRLYLPGAACGSALLTGGAIRRPESWVSWMTNDTFLGFGFALSEARSRSPDPVVQGLHEGDASNQWRNLCFRLWSHMLGCVVAGGRGGAFFICDRAEGEKHPGQTCDVDFGQLFARALERSADHTRAVVGARWEQYEADRLMVPLTFLQNRWVIERQGLFQAAEQVAGLANVDGCVLFDRQFRVHRFGVKLRFDPSTPIDAELEDKGTRHQSAYRFCYETGASGFVVSQDGHLTVIWNRLDRREPAVLTDRDYFGR